MAKDASTKTMAPVQGATAFANVHSMSFVVALGVITLIFAVEMLPGFFWASSSLDAAKIAAVGEHGWLLIALVVMSLATNVMVANSASKRAPASVSAPNQYVFQDVKTNVAVQLAEHGAAGEFNRAQRGYFNFLESLPMILAQALALGAFFPRVAAALLVADAGARVLGALGYALSTSARVVGFLLAKHIAEAALQGILLFVGVRAVGLY